MTIDSTGDDLKIPLLMSIVDLDSNSPCSRGKYDDEDTVQHREGEHTLGRCHDSSVARATFCHVLGLNYIQPHLSSRTLHIAMISKFSTSYNVVNIGYVMEILAKDPTYQKELSPLLESICSSSLIIGMITGQLIGGILGDYTTRTKALMLVMITQIVSSIGSALVFDTNTLSALQMLTIWRFFLGIGCGGVYPLAATMTSEISSSEVVRRKLVALTFSMQGLGFLCVPLGTWFLVTLSDSPFMWRVILGLGGLPGLIIVLYLYYYSCLLCMRRYKGLVRVSDDVMEDTEENTSIQKTLEIGTGHVEATEDHKEKPIVRPIDDEIDQSEILNSPIRSYPSIVGTADAVSPRNHFLWSLWEEPQLFRKLCGTALCWFFFDTLFYGNTLFTPVVLEKAFGPKESISEMAIDGVILSLIALPGYYVSVICIGTFQTPKYVQLQGFTFMGLIFGIIGLFFSAISENKIALLTLYGLTFFFANYGPNTTTFILPSLTYSPLCRSTLNGISAASGKLGALFGALLFEPATDLWGDGVVMMICASLSIIGFVLTWVCVSTNDQCREPLINNSNNQGENNNAIKDFELL
jgi:PHS family inorganic phosphate transporter-like MFS transporter